MYQIINFNRSSVRDKELGHHQCKFHHCQIDGDGNKTRVRCGQAVYQEENKYCYYHTKIKEGRMLPTKFFRPWKDKDFENIKENK